MFLTENYRSHPVILQFPSDNFYGKELIARSEHLAHPRFEPLLFFSVDGVEEARENSFINAAEVEEIVKRVELLANDWPEEWKKKDLSQIGVISAYMTQVLYSSSLTTCKCQLSKNEKFEKRFCRKLFGSEISCDSVCVRCHTEYLLSSGH